MAPSLLVAPGRPFVHLPTNDPRALGFAPGSPVRSADPERKALPVVSGQPEEAMPHAWWRKG